MADVMEEMDQLNVTYTVEEQLAEKELMETINRFLEEMSPKDRNIFVRRYWFLDPVSAISKRHHMSAGSVKMKFIQKPEKAVETVGKRRRTHMKKFDFSKEFGNIDPKYIEEAERESE